MSGDEADARRAAGGDAPPIATADGAPARLGSVAVVSSGSLLDKHGTLAIRHRGAIYYLRETRFGKLILTK